MNSQALVRTLARVATRALLRPDGRESTAATSAYLWLYLLSKWLLEHRERRALRRLVEPGMWVLDVGANVGFYSLRLAHWVGPAGRVLAFEPDPFCFRLLAERARRSRFGNLEPYALALAERSGKATLYRSAYHRADNRLHSHEDPDVAPCAVEVTTVDAFLAARSVPLVDAMKVDVQGTEEAVLRGAQGTLRQGTVRWVWIEFSPPHLRAAGSEPAEFLRLVEELGWEASEPDRAGRLAPIGAPADFLRRLGDDYVDLVLRPRR